MIHTTTSVITTNGGKLYFDSATAARAYVTTYGGTIAGTTHTGRECTPAESYIDPNKI